MAESNLQVGVRYAYLPRGSKRPRTKAQLVHTTTERTFQLICPLPMMSVDPPTMTHLLTQSRTQDFLRHNRVMRADSTRLFLPIIRGKEDVYYLPCQRQHGWEEPSGKPTMIYLRVVQRASGSRHRRYTCSNYSTSSMSTFLPLFISGTNLDDRTPECLCLPPMPTQC